MGAAASAQTDFQRLEVLWAKKAAATQALQEATDAVDAENQRQQAAAATLWYSTHGGRPGTPPLSGWKSPRARKPKRGDLVYPCPSGQGKFRWNQARGQYVFTF